MNKKFVCVSVGLILALAMAGCATMAKGPSDEELIQETLGIWEEGMLAHDVDKIQLAISENFANERVSSKAELGEMNRRIMESGYLEGMEISMENSEQTREGDVVTVYPIDLTSPAGALSVKLTLTKEENAWLITSLAVDGM